MYGIIAFMKPKLRRLRARKIATRFVKSINKFTKCQFCGKQPIEWHRKEHVEHSNWRVSSLRTQGCSIQRIKAEMALCAPLCRSCHMKEDGRGAILHASQPYQKGCVYVTVLPCSICKKLHKPLRKGLCYNCYERHRVGGRQFKHILCCGCCANYKKQEVRKKE